MPTQPSSLLGFHHLRWLENVWRMTPNRLLLQNYLQTLIVVVKEGGLKIHGKRSKDIKGLSEELRLRGNPNQMAGFV